MRERINTITYIEKGDHYEGHFKDGRFFLFDKEDYEFVSNNYWHFSKDGYVRSTKKGRLHRCLMKDELRDKLQVDHINRIKTDNRRSNLRVVTNKQNSHNKSLLDSNKSGHTGVIWRKDNKKWRAFIFRDKFICLGQYDDLDEAINARKKAEKIYHSIT